MSEQESERELRQERLARALENVLVEGDAFQVYATKDGVEVSDTPSFKFQEKHPRIYGRLLSLNQQMEGGCVAYMVGLVAVAAIALGLNVGWWEDLIGARAAEKLNSWWFYGLLLLVVFVLTGTYYERIEKRAYRRGRSELLYLLQEANLDRDTLLVQIKDDPELGDVVKQLKLDPGPFKQE